MKTIKVKFIGFWAGFTDEDNFIYNILKKYYDVQLTDDPDYLFYSTFLPQNFNFAEYDCVRIFYSGENVSPDFNYCDYAISFDNITYNDRYIRLPLFLIYDQLTDAENKHIGITADTLAQKEEFANYVVGNSLGMQERTDIFNLLNNYKKVASVGTYLNNTGYHADNIDKKLAFQNKCRFSITFESVSQAGFVTEKIMHGFAAKTVPIYLGDCDIDEIFNEKAFINGHKFDSLEAIVERVKEIEENPQLWLEMVSTPCFNDPDYSKKKMAELDSFLRNIMDQPLEKAFRRPLKFHVERYKEDLKEYVQLKKNARFQRFLKAKDKKITGIFLKIFGR